MQFIFALLVAGAPLVCIEFLARYCHLKPELTRKATHVLSALVVISLTNFCSLHEIGVIALLFLLTMSGLRRWKIWHSLYSVRRTSLGELAFPLGVIIAAFATTDRSLFVMILLLVGLADTAAGLAGQRYSQPALPVITTKSYAGSFACLVCSVVIIALYTGRVSLTTLGLAVVVTLVEAVSPYGLDNASIPAAVLVYRALLS